MLIKKYEKINEQRKFYLNTFFFWQIHNKMFNKILIKLSLSTKYNKELMLKMHILKYVFNFTL